ncbi:hypothetical protein QBC39DRAFT_384660 [Podospora conica]|nr:hypothetical protein QBC39DRAFT_384660 [Schizothecium conicum]
MKYSSGTLALFASFAWQTRAWNHISERQLQDALDASVVHPTEPSSLALEPEYLTLQTTEPLDPNIVTFDCSAHPLACTHLDVPHPSDSPAPTIRIYHRDGRVDTHHGAHTARAILHFLHRTLRPTVLDLGIPQHPSMLTMDDVVFLAQIHPEDADLYHAFYEVAGEFRDRYSFVVVPPEEGARGSVVRCVRNWEAGWQVERMMGPGEVGADVGGELRGFVKGCGEDGAGAGEGKGEADKMADAGEGTREHEEL